MDWHRIVDPFGSSQKKVQYREGNFLKSFHCTVQCSFFDRELCLLRKWKYSGIKICSKTAECFRAYHFHTEDTGNTWTSFAAQRDIILKNQRQTRRKCSRICPRGKLITGTSNRNQNNPNQMSRKSIRCGHGFLNDPRTYFFWSIPDTSTLDFTYLTALCRESEEQPVGNETECIFFDSVNVSTKPTVHCESGLRREQSTSIVKRVIAQGVMSGANNGCSRSQIRHSMAVKWQRQWWVKVSQEFVSSGYRKRARKLKEIRPWLSGKKKTNK
ncbi:hypothetical protein An12g09430 [Aspergillus niger]|uniref:Uncharacterized protein n=3 Tax=Aspergillus niger TaxID=5061 RepID=A2R0Q6_ASPNC|nr:hypothetical protein An12g09430 [Aspergillus niger]CAK41373.1 hypothetical protein An12g09430 [Aspergillus niger]